MRLRSRHDPQGNEQSIVDRIIGQMTPEYCVQLTQTNPKTSDDLRTASESWVAVFGKHKPEPDPRKEVPERTTVRSTAAGKMLARCWFCPQWHYNRECPHRPVDYDTRHPTAMPKSGEEARAAPRH